MKRLLVALLLVPGWASAATYYVDCNANGDAGAGTGTGAAVAWKTIGKVNGSSFSAGDSVLFNKGCTWGETLYTTNSGSAGNPITYGAYGTGVAPIIDGGTARAIIVGINHSYVTFEDLRLTRSTYVGFWVNDGGDGSTAKSNSITIQDCVIDTMQVGVLIYGDNWTIARNTFHTLQGQGIETRDWTGKHSANFLIEHNVFRDQTDGIADEGGIMIDGDTFMTNADYSSGIIRYNLFERLHGRGVDVVSGATQVYYNVFMDIQDGAGGSGVAIELNGTGLACYNNSIYNVQNIGVMVNENGPDPAVQAIVKNNIVSAATANHLIWITNNAGLTPTIDNNVYLSGGTKFYWKGTDYTFTNWKTQSGGDAASAEADPLFLSSSDFRLQSGSPAINAGVGVGLTSDRSGTWVRGLPDIGAYEYLALGQAAMGANYYPTPVVAPSTTRFYPPQ